MLITAMLTPGITAPASSVTVPLSVAVALCAETELRQTTKSRRQTAAEQILRSAKVRMCETSSRGQKADEQASGILGIYILLCWDEPPGEDERVNLTLALHYDPGRRNEDHGPRYFVLCR